jgi:(1->4)-alpha-D-glucan 1-alpha-D-glucosylmutase
MIGAWPIDRERLHRYAEKAAREAGNSTTWNDPEQGFEAAVRAAIDRVYDDSGLHRAVEEFVEQLRPFSASNGLAAKLLQLTGPGVPDVYQGSELWERSLVDPDNRAPVDLGLRELLLGAVQAGAHPGLDEEGSAKLLVTHAALTLRRDHPELFGKYLPLAVAGARAAHAIAVDRGGAIPVVTRLPAGLAAAGGWGDTRLLLPPGDWTDVILDRPADSAGLLGDLLDRYPVALLVRR